MSGLGRVAVLITILGLLLPSVTSPVGHAYLGAPVPADTTDSTRVNIVFTDGLPANLTERIANAGGTLLNTSSRIKFAIAHMNNGTNQSTFINTMRGYSDVLYAGQDVRGALAFVPNDRYYYREWGIQRVGAQDAWNISVGNFSKKLAIIDTGVLCAHPDLLAHCDGLNSTTAVDAYGHGTFVAGIAAAVANNTEGIAGMSQSRFIANHVLTTDEGYVMLGDVAIAIVRAIDYADVITASLGFRTDCMSTAGQLVCLPLRLAVQQAYGAGKLLVAAAGNDFCAAILYPAAYDEVIAVGATDGANQRAEFSSCGDQLDIVAPGIGILSTAVTNQSIPCMDSQIPSPELLYCFSDGTSFSTPIVSGAAMLLWSYCPGMARDSVRGLLLDTNNTQDLGLPAREQGAGLLRIDRSMTAARNSAICTA